MHRTFVAAWLVFLCSSLAALVASADSTPDVGTWSELGPPSIVGSAVFDAAGDRIVLCGYTHDGARATEVYVYALGSGAGWVRLATNGTPPPPRTGFSAVYDSRRQRMIVYGGADPNTGLASGDVWSLSLGATATWTLLSGGPAAYAHAAIYDPVRDVMVTYGGWNSPPGINTLQFSPSLSWTHDATAHQPPQQFGLAAHYDGAHRRMVLYGGLQGLLMTSFIEQLWVLNLDGTPDWTMIPAQGTPPRSVSSIYDPLRDRIDVLSDATLFSLTLDGAPVWTTQPAPATAGGAVEFDPLRERALFYDRETWTHSFQTEQWTLLDPPQSPVAPPPLFGPRGVFDPIRHRAVMFGGYPSVNDTWALSPDSSQTWQKFAPLGSPPAPRFNVLAVFDSAEDRMIVFGGVDDSQIYRDVYALEFSPTPRWAPISPLNGAPPASQGGECVAFDSARRRMIVIGDGVFALSLAGVGAWSGIFPAGATPLPRPGATAIYDVRHDRVILYGGSRSGATSTDDVWALPMSGGAWQKLMPTPIGNLPATRSGHTAIYDPIRGRMVMFGGPAEAASKTYCSAWELRLDDPPVWSELAAPGGAPGRRLATAVYDASANRMIVIGGQTDVDPLNSAWALQWDRAPFAPIAACPAAVSWRAGRTQSVTFAIRSKSIDDSFGYSITNARHWAEESSGTVFVPAGGTVSIPAGITAPDTAQSGTVEMSFVCWRLADPSQRDSCTTFASDNPLTGVDDALPGARLAIRRVRAGGDPSIVSLSLDVRAAGNVTIDLFDVSGRRWARSRFAPPGRGGFATTLTAAHALPSGIYIVRLSQGREVATARFAITR